MLNRNERQDEDAVILLFVKGKNLRATNTDLYFGLRLGTPLPQPETIKDEVLKERLAKERLAETETP